MNKHLNGFVLYFLILLPIVSNFAQDSFPFDFTITNWTLDDGLPQNSVNDIVQTEDGYIWVATNGGLARFNGAGFKIFNEFNSPGLVSNRILNLFNDKENRLWVGTNEGLSYYYNGKFKKFPNKSGFEIVSSLDIRQDKNGTIWILTFPGFYQYRDGKFKKQEITNDENLRSRAMKGEADFFVPFRNSIYAVINNKVVECCNIGEYPDIQILDVVENPKGSIWLSTTSNRLINIKNGISKQYNIDKENVVNYLDDLFVDSEKRLWIGGSQAINIFINNKFYKISSDDGLPVSQIHNIFQDREGNFWIGSETEGLIRISGSIISNYGKRAGLKNNQILSLNIRNNGDLLIGTNGGGIYELQNGKISYSSLNHFFKQKYIWALFEDSKNRIWSNINGLYYVKDERKFPIPEAYKYDLHNIFSFYESRDGAIWIGYQFGLLRYFNNEIINYSIQQGLSETDVRCITEDNEGNIWAGTVNGLFKINQGQVIPYLSIPGLKNDYFRAIYQDKDSIMWFGTYGGGLLRFKDNKFFIFSTDNGLSNNVISHIIEDEKGYFWMGNNRGIQRVKRQELNNFADGEINSFFVYNYDKSDGMISSETNGGFQPSAVKDLEGNIYFPTISGITEVHTRKIAQNKTEPPVHIGEIFVNGQERKLNDLKINYDSSDVEIYFDILSYTLPNKNRAKYIMEGHDNGWNNAGEQRYARYPNLPPGDYIFRVIGANSNNVWNEQGASISISVLPPFWMTWWFRSIIITILLSIGPVVYYRRVTFLKNKQQLQRDFSEKLIFNQEVERQRIAQELHDSLGQELLLIKNRAMLGIKKLDDETKVKKQFEYISNSAASAIEQVRNITHNLRPPELDRLGLTETIYSIVQEIESVDFIKIKSESDNIDGCIPKEKEINLIRIIQEALSNILKHSKATEINMSIINSQNHIFLLVKDNGSGFNSENHANGLGLMGIRERVDILGGTFEIESAPDKGTILKVVIPRTK